MTKLDDLIQSDVKEFQESIKKTGGHFFKYSACRSSNDVVYDIENIRHEQIFAQTPLNMNDPFDSLPGVDEQILIDVIMEAVHSMSKYKSLSGIISFMLNLFLGQGEKINEDIDGIWAYLSTIRRNYKIKTTSVRNFVDIVDGEYLHKHAPKKIKNKYSCKELKVVSYIISRIYVEGEINRSEFEKLFKDNAEMFDELSKFKDLIENHELQNKMIEGLKDCLSMVTVSCFCETGWQNQLMWAHYAGAYSGICVEYDFSNGLFENEGAYFKKVQYSMNRPSFNVKKLGKIVTNAEGEICFESYDCVDLYAEMINYLTLKNDCWNYENEWRLFSFGERNVPKLIDAKNKIASVTFGMHVEEQTKALIVAICKMKNIVCYDLVVDPLSYELHRKVIDMEGNSYNLDKILGYLRILSEDIRGRVDIYRNNVDRFVQESKNKIFNKSIYRLAVQNTYDLISNIYLMKLAVKQIKTVNEYIYSIFIHSDDFTSAIKESDNFLNVIRQSIPSHKGGLVKMSDSGVIDKNEYEKMSRDWDSIEEILGFINKLECGVL